MAGVTDFEACYSQLFGERWAALRNALCKKPRYGARLNPHCPDPGEALSAAQPVAGLPSCRWSPDMLAQPVAGADGLLPWYLMDAASVVAAEALDVQAGDDVLDLCAAPGGKSWILGCFLGEEGRLVANERSAGRRARLKRVLQSYLPADVLKRVEVTAHDASRWSQYQQEAFDRVLLDAPCSSEAHVLEDARAMKQWGPARSKGLAKRQYAMLASALEVVRVGGRILYSTCALAELENDGVVERLLTDRRRAGRSRTIELDLPIGERTQHGWQILPDSTGWGPIYMAAIERLS